MRISDWSSDVCSSDLLEAGGLDVVGADLAGAVAEGDRHRPGEGADGAGLQRAGQEVVFRRGAVGRRWQIEQVAAELHEQAFLAAFLGVDRLDVHHVPDAAPAGNLAAAVVEAAGVDLAGDLDAGRAGEGVLDGFLLAWRIDAAPARDPQKSGTGS